MLITFFYILLGHHPQQVMSLGQASKYKHKKVDQKQIKLFEFTITKSWPDLDKYGSQT